jgi:hypothetical protein
MPLVLKKLEDSPEHTVAGETTLLEIAEQHVPDTLGTPMKRAEALAQLNWGAKSPREVARALAETIGLSLADAPDLDIYDDFAVVAGLTLKPEDSPKLRLPEPWVQADVASEADKKISVRRPRPANTVTIGKLDKWFVPETEKCDVDWKIGGREATAGKLHLNVYASNYCKFKDWSAELGAFTESADLKKMPVFTKDDLAHTERGGDKFEWDGEATADDGCLKKSADPLKKRHVNVAFSPYTAHMRYFKNSADKDARLELKPFWPMWDEDDDRVADSFKLNWTLHDTGGKLKQGLLTIVDGQDRPVFRKRLVEADLSDGDHEFDWGEGDYADGVTPDGKSKAEASQTPYRARIEAHKPAHEEEGLALAAMHSEVRIWVHPETLHEKKDAYVATDDKSSLLYSVAPLSHADADWNKDADENLWLREQLSKFGFHPGPIKDAAPEALMKAALKDLKQSVPKVRAGGTGDFTRIDDTATPEANLADVKAALEAIRDDADGFARYKRPWFGKADATRDDYADNWGDDVADKLRNAAEELILWIDDRHFYTSVNWVTEPAGQAPQLFTELADHTVNQRPDRGGWMNGDVKIDHDARDMTRSWVPIQVQPVLMKKDRTLHDTSDYLAAVKGDADLLAAMRRAVGPIRIDWSFDEIDGDYDPDAGGVNVRVNGLDAAMYGTHSRSKGAIEWLLNDTRHVHRRKDVKRRSILHNARDNRGGVRPANAARYYRNVFGRTADGNKHLIPWKTSDDDARESVVTCVHDDLGPGHADDEKFAKRRGAAGVGFMPSLVAGDGYRVRAQVRFDKTAGYSFPNAEDLGKRYPRLAQSHSAKMRMWRKSSIRAYVQWAPTNHFGTAFGQFKKHFAQANVHYVVEGGGAAPLQPRPNALFPPEVGGGLNAEYVDAAVKCLPTGNALADPATMALHQDHVWPWHADDNYGQRTPVVGSGALSTDARAIFEDNELSNQYYVNTIMLATKIVDSIEKSSGLLRGNVIVEMQVSPKYYYMNYECDKCGAFELWLENSATPSKVGGQCAQCADAARKLLNTVRLVGHYTCSTGGHAQTNDESTAAGSGWTGQVCDQRACGGLLADDMADAANYLCDSCGYTADFPHMGGVNNHKVGSDCPRGCGGKLGPTAAVYASQDYTCNGCAANVTKVNAGKVKDAGVGANHICNPGDPTTTPPTPPVTGLLAAAAAPNYVYDFTGKTTNAHQVEPKAENVENGDELPGSSLGLPVGVSVNFKCDVWGQYECAACNAKVSLREPTAVPGHHQNKWHNCGGGGWGQFGAVLKSLDTNSDLWAHEVGHNHSLSHANNAGGEVPIEHDNRRAPWATATMAGKRGDWDRSCLMAYTDFHPDYDIETDLQYMCYRCLLRSRGWKVTPLHRPPGAITN